MLHTVQTLAKNFWKPLMSFLWTLWCYRQAIGIVVFCYPSSLLKAELLPSDEKWPKLVRLIYHIELYSVHCAVSCYEHSEALSKCASSWKLSLAVNYLLPRCYDGVY